MGRQVKFTRSASGIFPHSGDRKILRNQPDAKVNIGQPQFEELLRSREPARQHIALKYAVEKAIGEAHVVRRAEQLLCSAKDI